LSFLPSDEGRAERKDKNRRIAPKRTLRSRPSILLLPLLWFYLPQVPIRPDEEVEHVRNTRMHRRKDTVTTAKSTAVFRRRAAKKEICNLSSHISFRTRELRARFRIDKTSNLHVSSIAQLRGYLETRGQIRRLATRIAHIGLRSITVSGQVTREKKKKRKKKKEKNKDTRRTKGRRTGIERGSNHSLSLLNIRDNY